VLRKLLLIIVPVAAVACAPAQQRSAPAPKPSPNVPGKPARSVTVSVSVSGMERKVIDATNRFRRDNGLESLKPSVKLISIAQNHARNMARQDKFGDGDKNGHILDGRNMEYRIKAGGYEFGRVAENVGFQLRRSDPVDAMMKGWKASSGHRRNMLTRDVTDIGVGAAQGKSRRWYFVQLFGRPSGAPRIIRTSD
jgi:uncharacterized protein YkwD